MCRTIFQLFKNAGLVFSAILIVMVGQAGAYELPEDFSEESKKCIKCHKQEHPAIVQQWGASKHYRAKVGCYECHKADPTDADAFKHDGEEMNKHISIIVSPKDCGQCHKKEVKQTAESHHSRAGRILGSLDNLLAEVIEGNNEMVTPGFPHGNSAAAVNGCWQCHGSQVKVLKDGSLDAATWPNTGIGRLNPDGTEGACSACHSRHAFSVEQARNPETCGKCHMGPDHPQIEIYNESKHGIAYRANKHKMNMDSAKWIVGEDYSAAPTCATCHMSATKNMSVTHNVGDRISWNLRAPISFQFKDGKDRRRKMKKVCVACHSGEHTDNFYIQFDALVELYNGKFAIPGKALYTAAKPLLKPAKFSNKLDWIWFELWHHEGRRARMAASMQGPDYTHWHGTYDLAKHFYAKMVPELNHLIEAGMKNGKAAEAKVLKAKLDEVLNSKNHKWFLNKMDPADKARRKKAADDFKKRYDKRAH